VDIQSACSISRARDPLAAIKFAIGDTADIYDGNIRSVFDQLELDSNDVKRIETNLAQRAWVSQRLSTLRDMEARFENVPRINTMTFTSAVSKVTPLRS
jgi:regulator of nonsense transcripts 1